MLGTERKTMRDSNRKGYAGKCESREGVQLMSAIFTQRVVRVLGLTLLLAGAVLSPVAWGESVRGTSVQVGHDITIPDDGVTLGDAVTIFGDLTVLGEVQGNAVAIGGDARIEGKVTGDVVGVGGTVYLGENAEVGGEVTAVGAGIHRSPGAKVAGSVNNIAIGQFLPPRLNLRKWRWHFGYHNPFMYLLYLAGLFSLALLTLSLFPSNVANVAKAIERQWGRNLLIGALVLLLIGPLTLIIAITIIGIPLAFLLWVGFFLAKILGYVAFVNLLGRKIAGTGASLNVMAQLAVGVLVLGLVRYVPVIGPLASFFVTVITLGAVLDTKFGTNRPWLPPRSTE